MAAVVEIKERYETEANARARKREIMRTYPRQEYMTHVFVRPIGKPGNWYWELIGSRLSDREDR